MAPCPGLRAALGVLLVACAAYSAAGRVLLDEDDLTMRAARERLMLDTSGLVLSLDAAEAEAGSDLQMLVGTKGEANWPTTNDPDEFVKLFNAEYDRAYGGSVVFSAPGSYGLSSELLTVVNKGWGSQFTAVAWYKAGPVPDPNAVLLQVEYTDDKSGLWGSSATWRVGGFTDKTQGFVPVYGVQATAPYSVGSDCWQQLAIVKSGFGLTFYYDKEVAGVANGTFVVNDYGTAGIALGVDFIAAGGSNVTAVLDPAQAGVAWLGGNLGMLAVFDRALDAAGIAAIYDEQQALNRYTEALCSNVPALGVSSPPPAAVQSPLTPPDQPPAAVQPPSLPVLQSPPPPSFPPPGTPPKPPSTMDKSTAQVTGGGTTGSVANKLSFTGGDELANVGSDPAKQQGLKEAIVASLNVDPSYTADNVQLNVIKVEQRTVTRVTRTTVVEWVVVCEYILIPTEICPVEVLEKEEINIYLFIRVQQPTIPWWTGPTATVCQCKEDGECNEDTPPVPPPPVIPDCAVNICFLLDGSKSLMNVDAWNDVTAAARSIMYSINSPTSVFDVFWFSNEVEKIGDTVTGAQVAEDNSFIRSVVNTVPNAHGTFMSQAITTCQGVLSDAEVAPTRSIVLITDGKPTDREAALAAAQSAQAQGIKMVVVGAGEIDYDTLLLLSSGASYTFANYNLDASQLLLLADLASQGVCSELD